MENLKLENIQDLINMAWEQLGFNTDAFKTKSVDFYNLLKHYKEYTFSLNNGYELVFELDIENALMCVYVYSTDPNKLLFGTGQQGVSETNADTGFLMVIGRIQEKLNKSQEK